MKRLVLAMGLILGAGWAAVAQAAVDIQEVRSDGGFNAWLVEDHSIPFVALELRFKGGGSLDAEGKRGATNLMLGLLEEGSGDLDAQGFAAAKEALAARIGYDISDDSLSVSARFLTENRDEAAELLRASLVSPSFDEESIERVRQQILASLRSDATDPDTLAAQAFDALVYGDHPYGTDYSGTLDSVTALTREDVLTAWRNAIAQDRVYVAAAGDISAEELGALMDRLLSGLPQQGAPLPARVEVQTSAGVDVVPFTTPQSVAFFGHRGIERHDPDFFAAYMLNQTFGSGGFDSRLMEEVREKRGLTYGVYSYLLPKDHAEMFLGRVASGNGTMAEAIAVIQEEWAKIARDGITEEELEKVKTYLTGAYPLRFDGNARIAEILVGMQQDDLTPDYITSRNDKIEAVTLEEINRVAAELFRPEELTFVVVGEPEGLEPTSE